MLASKHAVASLPTGDIALAVCGFCGFVSNTAFDPTLMRYGTGYEESQGYSPTFRKFHEELAERLDERVGIAGRRILEIGCGKGDFLAVLGERGAVALTGFDPGYCEGRVAFRPDVEIRIEPTFFPPSDGPIAADLVVSKMTLEHIAEPLSFLRQVREGVEWGPEAHLFLMVPNAGRVWSAAAFEDVYYEHCSYFTKASLAACLEASGFAVAGIWLEYADQYVCAVAAPAQPGAPSQEVDTAALADVETFSPRRLAAVQTWRERFSDLASRRIAVWGSGSKAVSFLSACRPGDRVLGVVDINPFRQGGWLPPEGHRILAPDELKETQVELVVAMNGVYGREIRENLESLGLDGVCLETL